MNVVGSYVVFDPTGRDLLDCMIVGQVKAVTWESDDDGNPDGSPRPILQVSPNGEQHDDVWITRVKAVL